MPSRLCLVAAVLFACSFAGAIRESAWGQQPSTSPPRSGSPADGIAWPRDDWNPEPDAADVILPLPCKGAIAFRRVLTGPPRPAGKSNQLEDRQVTLGSADDPLAYVGYLRGDFIAGGFFTPEGQRYYLIGKYEVTVQQYQAVMGEGSCRPTEAEKAALPMTGISWFDAVEFTRRLNKWLYVERLDALPKSAGRSGFVRLPTESEWEFAARGGMAVSDVERGNNVFVPSGADIGEYVWFAGPESASGSAKPIGSRKPNPLKIYDIFGNAEEIMLEPFRLNRVGRLHGQHGGMVVRGGSYMTPRESIRASARTEFALFEQTTRSEMRLPTFGFRLAVGSTALSQSEQVAVIRKEWDDARRTETSVAGKTPLQLLEGLLRQATTPSEKAQLQAAIGQFNAEVGRRNEVQERAIKSLLSSATTIRSNLNLSADFFDQLYGLIEDGKRTPALSEVGKKAEERFKQQKPKFDSWATTYGDLIQQLASDFPDPDVRAQVGNLKADYTARGKGYDVPGLEAVAADVAAYRSGRARETSKLIRSAIGQRRWLTP